MGKVLLFVGFVLVALGALLTWGPKIPFGALGRLPGDFRIERPGLRIYFPLTTSILVSVAITLLLRLFGKK